MTRVTIMASPPAADIASRPQPPFQASDYRPNVGVALFNAQGLVFVGRRTGQADAFAWQMPQGGIDPGESAQAAAARELTEEAGVPADKAELIAQLPGELYYTFPAEVRAAGAGRKKNWAGQRQSWFAFRLTGCDADIDLFADGSPEFDAWRWEALSATPALVIPWKRAVYEAVAAGFAPLAAPIDER